MGLLKTINDLKNVFPEQLTNEFVKSMPRRELTAEEKALPYSKYYHKEMATIPQEDLDIVNKGPICKEDALSFNEISKMFDDGYLTTENGYCYMGDGTGFAASKVFMKDVTLDMTDWWFNWHPLHDLRYAIWCPIAHNGIKAKTPEAHLDSSGVDLKVRNYNKIHFPDEGFNLAGHEIVKIDFKDPKLLGLDIKNTRAYIANVTKVVGPIEIPITTFVHVAREVEAGNTLGKGVEFRSRYFQQVCITKDGKFQKPKIKMPKSVVASVARNNCLHSLTEYNNLASILPSLYAEHDGKIV